MIYSSDNANQCLSMYQSEKGYFGDSLQTLRNNIKSGRVYTLKGLSCYHGECTFITEEGTGRVFKFFSPKKSLREYFGENLRKLCEA